MGIILNDLYKFIPIFEIKFPQYNQIKNKLNLTLNELNNLNLIESDDNNV